MLGSHFLLAVTVVIGLTGAPPTALLEKAQAFGMAQESAAQDEDLQRPKIGLVLSGGGARGAAHLGVLKVLEENHIPVDMIAGTSFGALVGGLYASGYSADELTAILEDIDWSAVLSTEAPRVKRSFRRKQDDEGFLIQFRLGIKKGRLKLPSGLVTPNNLRLLLRGLASNAASVRNFDNLAIPFRAVATDLETGRAVVLNKGDLASSMVASMAVPALFPPVNLDGRLLVDGGVSNNVPIDVARAMGADIVIVVDISTPMKRKGEISSFTSVINQLTLIMTNKNADAQLATLSARDIVIRPDIKNVGLVDFDRTGEVLPKGEAAAEAVLGQLRALALDDAGWARHLNARFPASEQAPVIDFVRIDNTSDLDDRTIRNRLTQQLGQPLDIKALSEDLTRIYGIQLFDEVSYRTLTDGEQTGLEVRTRSRENGSTQLRFGLAIQDDFEGGSGYQIAAGLNQLAINGSGGELAAQVVIGEEFSVGAELYQPLDYTDRFFLFANAEARKVNRNAIATDGSGDLVSQVRVSGAAFQLGGGRNFGNWGSARISLQRAFNKINRRIGPQGAKGISVNATTFNMGFEVDTLDNPRFPHEGLALEVGYRNSLSLLGGDSRVDNLQLGIYKPVSWGDNTLGLVANFGTSFNGTPNETDLFPLGGFLNLTAFAPGQLSGNHGGTLSVIYYRKVAGGPGYLTKTPLYLGTTFETGNVWNDASDISLGDLKWSTSLFVGADTLIGPIYLGGGIGSGGEAAAFLFIGQLF